MKRAALHNLGCKVNAYETQAMQELLEDAGYTIVPFHHEADVYVINTCSVTNIADRKSRQMIHRARRLNADAVLVATGCYVQALSGEELDALGVDVVLGNNRKSELVAAIEQAQKNSYRDVADFMTQTLPYEELSLSRTSGHTRAFLKIQDGCNQFCSYCIIPYVRGRVRSRDPRQVICEVQRLADQGFREIVLTGIHLSSYGADIGTGLIFLLEAVHEIEGIARIRLGSLEPKIITEELVHRMEHLPKLCPHFHLSLQSGCDETLARMNRRYTTGEYERACELLRRAYGDPALTTDVIVGFPGETDEEFAKTRRFVKRVGFADLHVFKYSVREGTRAARMENQVPETVKAKRSRNLIRLGEELSGEYRKRRIGQECTVLFEEPVQVEGVSCFAGFTPEYVRVAVPCGAEDASNRLCSVRIERTIPTGDGLLCIGKI